MNTNRIIFRWLTAVLIIALLLQFALITTPSVSAQGEGTATPTPSLPDRISCYGGTTGFECVEDTNNYIRMEINQVSGGGNGDVHLRFQLLPSNSPAEAMKRVNDLLIPDTRQGMFVTAVYAVLDLDKNEFTYVNAGHNPPLWLRSDGTIERLTRTAVALGVLINDPVEQRTIQLEKEDSLLLYTDGLTESFNNDGEFFGEARLNEAILANHCSSAEELMDVVEKSLLDFVQDMPPADDLTMLVVRRV